MKEMEMKKWGNEDWAYEEGNVEDNYSGGDIHSDSGSDRIGHGIVHGRLRPNGLVNSEEWRIGRKEFASVFVFFTISW